MTVEVTPIARSLGAVVSGVDLRERVSDDDFATIYDALMQHLVLFFRDQDLDDDQHLAFASRFGAPNVYPTTRARGLEQIEHIGVDRVLWSSDYPHPEGTYGATADVWQRTRDLLGDAAAEAIMGTNAQKLYGFDTP